MGLMARCDAGYAVGDRLRITLPVVGVVVAEIRWSLGGRIGCQLDRPIALSDYYDLLAVKSGRAHVCTPAPTAHLLCRLLHQKKNLKRQYHKSSHNHHTHTQ